MQVKQFMGGKSKVLLHDGMNILQNCLMTTEMISLKSGLSAKNGEKAGKSGWSERGKRRPRGEAPSRRGARASLTNKNFCIFYPKK